MSVVVDWRKKNKRFLLYHSSHLAKKARLRKKNYTENSIKNYSPICLAYGLYGWPEPVYRLKNCVFGVFRVGRPGKRWANSTKFKNSYFCMTKHQFKPWEYSFSWKKNVFFGQSSVEFLHFYTYRSLELLWLCVVFLSISVYHYLMAHRGRVWENNQT